MNHSPLLLLNIRRRFANNSSSSHSMILLDEPAAQELISSTPADGDFGWDAFTLTEPDDKKTYLRALLGPALARAAGHDVARAVLVDLGLSSDVSMPWDSVDHQSTITLPRTSEGDLVNLEFVKELVAWAMQERVAILGGNDNGGDHPDREKSWSVAWQDWLYDNNLVAWKDPTNDTWSLFSRRNGLTLRMSFHDITEAYTPDRSSEQPASRPNLVDIKITDACPFQCSYCYQGSTPKAPHADLAAVVDAAEALASAKVFEVALGGGEPTLHPDFDQIVHEFHQRGITPNATTRNLTWLRHATSLSTLEKMGGLAVSVDNVNNTKASLEAITKYQQNIDHAANNHSNFPNVSLQLVVGAQPKDEFIAMLYEAMIHPADPSITLLGYKTTGFGAAFQQDPAKKAQIDEANQHWTEWFLEACAKAAAFKKQNQPHYYGKRPWVSIDTVLAASSDRMLKSKNVTEAMYHRVEGAQSMYIDAVKQTMGPSSFAPASSMVPFDQDWLTSFQQFSPTPKAKRRRAP